MKNISLKFARNHIGSIIPITILLVAAIIPLTGLAVDVSYYGILRSNLEKASEAGAVAGAQEYFRSKADAGKAINSTLQVFKMNISQDTKARNYHQPTGPGRQSSYTYSTTFTDKDKINNLYRGSPIKITVVTDANRGKITVTTEINPKPFFPNPFIRNTKISLTKTAELPPYDVVFVVDLSGSMRFSTVETYIGTASRRRVGERTFMIYNDIIFSQGQNLRYPSRFTNGYELRSFVVTDVVINTPNVDISSDTTYSNGVRIYNNDAKRGVITNTNMTISLSRTELSGHRISELQALMISDEDKQLAQTYADNQNSNTIRNYFNRAAAFVEPHAGAVYGIRTFIDTIKIYGAAALKVGLVTFSSNSYTNDHTITTNDYSLRSNGLIIRLRDTFPYVNLVSSNGFNTIVDSLTIMASGGNGSIASPLAVNSFPAGGTNINAGLDNAKRTLDRSDRAKAEKIIILFTDGAPSHSFSSLGSKVKQLTDSGIKVYSVVLTLSINQRTIDNFQNAMENTGKAEPVIFINDPANLESAFTQIADELGLKLVN
ncbi:MAG: VWA domain-containing protein [Candidatus Melainabacteria bacterium]|nr:VWA domain-containing protein [Candidatus Melainabacteria bacterium]